MLRRNYLGLGIRLLLQHKKAVVFFYLSSLLVAAVLTVPLLQALQDSLGSSLYRETLLRRMDYDWWRLFQDRASGLVAMFSPTVLGLGPFAESLEILLDRSWTTLPRSLLATGVLYLLISSFFTAASLGSFAFDPAGTSIREFLLQGSRLAGRFFRIGILALATYVVLAAVVFAPMGTLESYLKQRASNDVIAFSWSFIRYSLVLLILLVTNMVFDYTKIKSAVEDRTSVVLSFLSALTLCISYFSSTFGLYLLVLAFGTAWVLVYGAVEYLIPQQSWMGIVGAFCWQQIFIAGRLGLKLLFYGSQMQLVLELEKPYRPLKLRDEVFASQSATVTGSLREGGDQSLQPYIRLQ
ncbi:MAG: hypothetical protein HY645_08075 [Acidobacteria bacterium]|nr:hypothetical protein [Acidobacteriota bacterium]